MRRGGLIFLIILALAAARAPQPALAGLASGVDARFNLTVAILGTVGFTTLCYYAWKNSPAERARGYGENLGPGEWYVAGYTGLSLLPAQDWQFFHSRELQGHTLKNVVYQPGVLGGLKFGRFFDSFPWFGVELETNFSRHAIRGQQVSISPPLPTGQANLPFPPDRFYLWDMQVNLLFRYGFLKDKEVTFGRLQPYIGIGPGFEVLYGTTDSAKNFAIEAQAGLRYMFSQKLAIFCEYKFSYQFDVEYEQFIIDNFKSSTMSFNVPHHRIVLGVSYHFKNLYGN